MESLSEDSDDLFGDDFEISDLNFELEKENICPETFENIPGLKIFRNFFSSRDQSLFMLHILENDIFEGLSPKSLVYDITLPTDLDFESVSSNQAMRFGELSPSLTYCIASIFEKIDSTHFPIFPAHLNQRKPLFDQVIYNLYKPSEGILPHVDLAKFEDGIVGISLLSSVSMVFAPARPEQLLAGYTQSEFNLDERANEDIEITINKGDLYVFTGDSRYLWTHSIPERSEDVLESGEILERNFRISITLRKLS